MLRRGACRLVTIGAAGLVIAGCGDGGESTSADLQTAERSTPSPATSKPLDRAVRRLEGAGHNVERDTEDAAHVEDSAEVRSGEFTFRVVAYDNQAAANGYLASLRGIVKTNPDQIGILRDLFRTKLVATGTIGEPAKLPITRFIRLAEIAMTLTRSR